jgi:phosphoserine phosphatase
MIPGSVHGIAAVVIQGKPFPLPAMKEAIIAAYSKLEGTEFPAGGKGVRDAYRVFTSGLLALNKALEETPGIGCEFAYPWVNLLLQGLNLSEFAHLATAGIKEELASPIHRHARRDPRGRWHYQWTSGARLYPEMKDLATRWQERGGEVVVSTASNRHLVEKIIAMTAFPCRRVIGMELAVTGNRFGRALAPGLRPNLGRGKVANIHDRLESEPVLVAGDSSNDYEMLISFPSTRMRLVVDRHAGGKIELLTRRALAGENGYLAQKIDPRRGEFKAAAGRD